jgi:hypothetical protein
VKSNLARHDKKFFKLAGKKTELFSKLKVKVGLEIGVVL